MKTLFLLAAAAHWVGTWGAAPSPISDMKFNNQTLREIVHVSIGGDTLRVRLSNAYNSEPVSLGAVHIALRSSGSNIADRTDRVVTFGGRAALQIPANAVLLSDPVSLAVPPAADLAVSIFIPGAAQGGGIHFGAQQTSYIAPGNAASAPSLTGATTTPSWIFLTGIEVMAPASAGSIVTLGDSITDGARSTPDTNHRWPDVLAARLHNGLSVVNMGIGANRILHDAYNNPRGGTSALSRFDHDVLEQPGVKYLIVLEGINDIGHPGSSAPATEAVSAEDIIVGLKQIIDRAHEHGIRVIGATITPFEGPAQSSRGYYTPEKETIREAVNTWIRTSNAWDGVIDFDKVMRDPQHPNQMLPAYDSGDQLHPGDAGYKAMGEAIDLKLFR
ncbi:MAG: SGNH/GDSL hydrolase family protein [Acidobacteriota bacterium]|nr:SGNH/GDSL hydrolase family protein [Acidobacteriota bacterium]